MKTKQPVYKFIWLFLVLMSYQLTQAAEFKDFPTSAEIKEQWENTSMDQVIKIRPEYGTIRTNGVDVPPLPVVVSLNKFLRDPDLLFLNMTAADVWQVMVNCHGSHDAAISAYAKGEVCKQALEELKSLANYISQYLSSVFLNSYRDYQLQCDELSEQCQYIKKEIEVAGKRGFTQRLTRQLERNLIHPLFHPLFTQIVLDESLHGFPFKKIEKKCGRFPCWGDGDYFYMISALDDILEEARVASIDDLIHSQDNNSDADKLLKQIAKATNTDAASSWQGFRKMRIAIEILGSQSIGVSTCQSWGLLTRQNLEIIDAMSFSKGTWFTSLPSIKEAIEKTCVINQTEVPYGYNQVSMLNSKLQQLFMLGEKIEYRKATIKSLLSK